jgi:predicted Rossmann-fold nucleotide-binding protein
VRTEFTDFDQLRAHRADGGDLRRAVLTGIDLTEAGALLRTPMDGALLLGCELAEADRRRAEAAGALVFPLIRGLPFPAYRTTLYTVAELFEGFDPDRPESYEDTYDAQVYRYFLSHHGRPAPLQALAERLHDHAMSEALREVLAHAPHPVAVMGGHALHRDSAGYRRAVDLGRGLGSSATGFTVLTGGGPGAMEAVPLGVRLHDRADVAEVVAEFARTPRFDSGKSHVDYRAIGRWLAAAITANVGAATEIPRTIGIPTWFYGHEPPNAACEVHAKYFENSVREDGLLTVATGGVVYTPGSAGTVQEVFADYAQNHYATVGPAAPMVFLDKDFWTNDTPAAPLVQQLARGRDAERWILITDDVSEAVAFLDSYAAERS